MNKQVHRLELCPLLVKVSLLPCEIYLDLLKPKRADFFLFVHFGLLQIHFPVLCWFLGEFVAQFKFTVLLMNNGPLRITSGPFDIDCFNSSHSLKDDELKVLLAITYLLISVSVRT